LTAWRARSVERARSAVATVRPELVIATLTLVALAVRVMLLLRTCDVPGDGPMRAIDAYVWSRQPYVPRWGWWPPGPLFLSGAVNLVVPAPLFVTRVIDLVLGTATVPVFSVLVRRTFGSAPALFGAAVLACLPLHAELSASSFTEAAFTFEIVAGLLLLTTALDGPARWARFVAALVCFAWASMTRYEVWPLLPLVPLYAYWRTRRLAPAVVSAVALAAFPSAWMIGNVLEVGNPLPGLAHQSKGALMQGEHRIAIADAIGLLWRTSVGEVGWPLALAIVAGVVTIAARRLPEERRDERALYLAAVGVFWMMMVYMATVRGGSFYARFLLFGLVMVLPWAMLPFRTVTRGSAYGGAALLLIAVASLASTGRYWKPTYLTHRQPLEIQDLAAWLSTSDYRHDCLLLTDLGWDASYLALYWPDVALRQRIVSAWMEDADIEKVLRDRPTLLVTRADDAEQQGRIARALGSPLDSAPKVYGVGPIEVYDIRALTETFRN